VKIDTFDKLFVSELKDLYSAEKQITKALPKMAKKATAPELKKAFESHLKETEGHVTRLERACEILGEKPTGKTCNGMKGLLEEGSEMMEEAEQGAILDAGMISAAQRVEHYEMAGYGTVIAYARMLGKEQIAKLLEQTLEEEKACDEKLTTISKVSNREAKNAA
jgi:ferritin-like metal-binding protein YciE